MASRERSRTGSAPRRATTGPKRHPIPCSFPMECEQLICRVHRSLPATSHSSGSSASAARVDPEPPDLHVLIRHVERRLDGGRLSCHRRGRGGPEGSTNRPQSAQRPARGPMGVPLPPLELPSVLTFTAATSSARSSKGRSVARTRAVADGEGSFFWPNENFSNPR